MPFVPLSAGGVQRATTQALSAPRVRVALEPHQNGVAVLAVEPTGLRPIGQLDPPAAEPYRRVLAPLAERGAYGTCTAEATVSGTVLHLGPAGRCLPAEGGPAPDGEPEAAVGVPAAGSARTGRLRDEDDESDVRPVAAGATAGVATPVVVRPADGPATADAGEPRGAGPRTSVTRARRGEGAPARLVLAGLTGLLLAGAIAQGLAGGATAADDTARVTADPGPVAVPGWGPRPAGAPVVVVGAPAGRPADAVSVPPAPPAGPARPAPRAGPSAEPAGAAENEESDRGSDDPGSDDPGSDDPGSGGPGTGSGGGRSDDDRDGAGPGGDSGRGDTGGGSRDDDGDRNKDKDKDRNGDRDGRGGGSTTTCTQAWATGEAPMRRGEPGYNRRLDPDGDGRACERRW